MYSENIFPFPCQASFFYYFMLLGSTTRQTGDQVRICVSQSSLCLSLFSPSLSVLPCLTGFLFYFYFLLSFFLSQMLLMMHQLLETMWKIFQKRNTIPSILLPGVNWFHIPWPSCLWILLCTHRDVFACIDIWCFSPHYSDIFPSSIWGRGRERVGFDYSKNWRCFLCLIFKVVTV